MGSSRLMKFSTFNAWGTFAYFFCQWATTVIVVRIAGFSDAGIYALAVSFTNLFGFISKFGVRKYQVVDVTKKHTDAGYFAARGVTSALSLAVFALTLLFIGFEQKLLLCCAVMFLFKLLESFGDVIHGVFQRYELYAIISLSLTLKGIVPVAAFAVVLFRAGSLAAACAAMTAAYAATIAFCDLPVLLRTTVIFKGASADDVKIILLSCIPMMLYSLAAPFMTFISRYAIEQVFSSDIVGYYSSISMIVVVINTMGASVFGVAAPEMSAQYIKGEHDKIKRNVLHMITGIAAVGAAGCLAGYFLGDFALELLFQAEILTYSWLLLPMILVSVLLTLAAYLSTVLVAFERRGAMLLSNAAGAVICAALIFPTVNAAGLIGTCICLGAGMFVQTVMLSLFVKSALKEKAGS